MRFGKVSSTIPQAISITVVILSFVVLDSYVVQAAGLGKGLSNKDPEVSVVVRGCLEARSDKARVCEASRGQLRALIKSGDKTKKEQVLKQVGRQRSQTAKAQLWSVLSDFDGADGAQSLRKFYMNRRTGAPANFYQQVRSRFKAIATPTEVAAVLSEYSKGDVEISKRTFPLVNLFSEDKYLPLLEQAFLATNDVEKRRSLYLVITKTNSLAAFETALRILAKDSLWENDEELDYFLRGLNFIRVKQVRSQMVSGLSSSERGARLGCYVVMQNFKDNQVKDLTQSALEKEQEAGDQLAVAILAKAIKRQDTGLSEPQGVSSKRGEATR